MIAKQWHQTFKETVLIPDTGKSYMIFWTFTKSLKHNFSSNLISCTSIALKSKPPQATDCPVYDDGLIPGANCVLPANLTVPFLCPATITLSPTSISARFDIELVLAFSPENVRKHRDSVGTQRVFYILWKRNTISAPCLSRKINFL